MAIAITVESAWLGSIFKIALALFLAPFVRAGSKDGGKPRELFLALSLDLP